jgi:hypothetical protein
MNSRFETRPPKRTTPRWQFLFGIYLACACLAIIFWNRSRLWERIRDYQTPEPERSQRKAFADQMDAFQQQGDYRKMRLAAAGWRKSHPADPNGFATEGFAAYYLGDIDASYKAWNRAAAMDPLVADGAAGWIGAINEVRSNWKEPIPPMVPATNEIVQAEATWKSRGDALLDAKKYDEIERTSARLLNTQASTLDGRSLATSFFDGLVGSGDAKGTEAQWRFKLTDIENWIKARPKSELAELALAACWVNGAWVMRGTGYSSEVTSDMRSEMDSRLANAGRMLGSQIAQGGKSPLFVWTFHNYSQLARIEGAPYDAVMDRETATFPAYKQIYFCRAVHLLPRWYGERGDWEAYASQVANNLGGNVGDILYAQIVWRLQRRYRFRNIWEESSADWPRTQRGFEAILKSNPRSLAAANDYFVLAQAAGDNALSRRILKTFLGGRVDIDYWRNMSYFAQARMSALRTR